MYRDNVIVFSVHMEITFINTVVKVITYKFFKDIFIKFNDFSRSKIVIY